MKADLYDRITKQILEKLEEGVLPWLQPWSATHAAGRITRPLRASGIAYQGINILTLWMAASASGYAAPIWMTFKQARDLSATVRRGEHGSPVVYADTLTRTKTDEKTGEEAAYAVPFMRAYTVFNVEQIEGLPAHYYAQPPARPEPLQRIARADAFFTATGATIEHSGNQPCYIPSRDVVRMPAIDFFRDAESYYATLAHEATHWTRHEKRLARELGRKRFGDECYAMEELVAELGAAFLCADLDLTPKTRPEHTAYIGHWIKTLKEDRRAIFTAAAFAHKAVEFLHKLQLASSAQAA